jgi:hypothetical protein
MPRRKVKTYKQAQRYRYILAETRPEFKENFNEFPKFVVVIGGGGCL